MSVSNFTITLGEKHDDILDKVMKKENLPTKVAVIRKGLEMLNEDKSISLVSKSERGISIDITDINQLNIKITIEKVEPTTKS